MQWLGSQLVVRTIKGERGIEIGIEKGTVGRGERRGLDGILGLEGGRGMGVEVLGGDDLITSILE